MGVMFSLGGHVLGNLPRFVIQVVVAIIFIGVGFGTDTKWSYIVGFVWLGLSLLEFGVRMALAYAKIAKNKKLLQTASLIETCASQNKKDCPGVAGRDQLREMLQNFDQKVVETSQEIADDPELRTDMLAAIGADEVDDYVKFGNAYTTVENYVNETPGQVAAAPLVPMSSLAIADQPALSTIVDQSLSQVSAAPVPSMLPAGGVAPATVATSSPEQEAHPLCLQRAQLEAQSKDYIRQRDEQAVAIQSIDVARIENHNKKQNQNIDCATQSTHPLCTTGEQLAQQAEAADTAFKTFENLRADVDRQRDAVKQQRLAQNVTCA